MPMKLDGAGLAARIEQESKMGMKTTEATNFSGKVGPGSDVCTFTAFILHNTEGTMYFRSPNRSHRY